MADHFPSVDGPKMTIQIRIGDTAYGTVERKVTGVKQAKVTINNYRLPVCDPTGECYVQVQRLPKDLDAQGYG